MTPLQHSAAHFFEHQLGVSYSALLTPISEQFPAGRALRGNQTYLKIEQARRQDDASLPMGAWEYDLKRADWGVVSSLSLQALRDESRDLQLLAWFLEAQLNQTGLAALAPCLVLLKDLCERFWQDLYPLAEDGDLEYRANVIRWIGEKLLPVLRLTPIIGLGRERQYNWADWEQAHRNEQLKASASKNNGAQHAPEGVSLLELNTSISSTGTEAFSHLQQMLSESLQAIEELNDCMDALFAEEAPGVSSMTTLLQQILSFVESELYKRGVRPQAQSAAATSQSASNASLPGAAAAVSVPSAAPQFTAAPAPAAEIKSRADAYARLAETAEFLMRLEPHSPVPYLVRRATEWGSLNTVELYQELFLRLGGQLNIFEMLGLETEEKAG
ncbi:type VI secretion system protein TssA [Massilia sp. W12]|uniref:type VI secretion system protein TssA n=1 Tax=Massilia sp. W12 TaxID=3126507 RepID=UPI0030D5F8FD